MEKQTYVKDIGIDINPPERRCNDEKCPWHGKVRIRGFVLEGKVVRIKHGIALIERYLYRKIPKYERYIVKRIRIKAHVPKCLDINVGDKVLIGETRPLSKTIHFVVINRI